MKKKFQASSKRKIFMSSRLKYIVIFLILLILAVVAVYFYIQYQNANNLLKNPNQQATAEATAIVARVGKLIELPTNENPTVATVSDKSKLANQPFFANAQNGDKILIYPLAKKAILYRPSINKIITVGAANIPTTPQTKLQTGVSPTIVPSPTVAQIISVAVYNGTGTTGLAKSVGQKISSKFPNDKVSTGDTTNSGYKKTVIIDLSGSNSKAASDLASLIGGQVSLGIPTGETKPNADIFIILGEDLASK